MRRQQTRLGTNVPYISAIIITPIMASMVTSSALKGTDTEEVKKKTQALIQASMKLGEAVYKNQQKSNEKNPDKKDAKNDKEKDNVVDAEVVDAKEDKEKRA